VAPRSLPDTPVPTTGRIWSSIRSTSQRYERGATLVTSNLPFDEWTEVFGSKRLTGALLDRLTHHVHILEMNGESFRLNQSKKRRKSPKST
jgi:DNA replication protein DnaC